MHPSPGYVLASAAFVLYRAFAFDTLLSRDRRITESGVVTMAATILCLALTLLLMFVLFGGLMYLGIVTVFPERLMEDWPGSGEATTAMDHLKLSLFLASMGVLAGSLGRPLRQPRPRPRRALHHRGDVTWRRKGVVRIRHQAA